MIEQLAARFCGECSEVVVSTTVGSYCVEIAFQRVNFKCWERSAYDHRRADSDGGSTTQNPNPGSGDGFIKSASLSGMIAPCCTVRDSVSL